MKEKIIIVFICFGLLQACSDRYDDGSEGKYTGEETEISFLPMPAGTPASDDTGIELLLEELDIIVCKDGKYQYHRSAWLTGSVYKTTLKAQKGVTLHFVANSRSILKEKEDLLITGSNWLTDIRPYLTDTYTKRTKNGISSLPMWGIKENINIEEGTENELGQISLLRAVAAVNVAVRVPETTFELKEAYLYFAPTTGIVIPLSENYMPEMPAGSTCSEKYKAPVYPENNEISQALYLYENDAMDTGTGTNGKRRSRIVIGGYLNGNPPMTYYPLDFIKENNRLQIIRNHKYEFDITSVSDGGYEYPDEAAKAPAINIDYEIYEWRLEGDRNIAVDGPHYLSLNRKKIELEPVADATVTVALTTNVPHDNIGFTLKDIEATEGIQNVLLQAESDLYRVEMLTENGEITSLQFTALYDWQADNEQIMTLTAGRIRFDITITQLESGETGWLPGGDTDIGDRE